MGDLQSRKGFCVKVSRSILTHINNELGKAGSLDKCLLQRTRHTAKKRQSGFVIPKSMIAFLHRQYCTDGDEVQFQVVLEKSLQSVTEESKSWQVPISSWKKERSGSYSVDADKPRAFTSALKVIEDFRRSPEESDLHSSRILLFSHLNKDPQIEDLRSLLYCSLLKENFSSKREVIVCFSQECEDGGLFYKGINEILNLKLKQVQAAEKSENLNVRAAEHSVQFSNCLPVDNVARYRYLPNQQCSESGTALASRVDCNCKNESCYICQQTASGSIYGPLERIHVCNSKNQVLAHQAELYHACCQNKSEHISNEYPCKQRDKYLIHTGVQSSGGLTVLEFLEMRKRQIKESFEAKLRINLKGENWGAMFNTMRASIVKLELLKNSAATQVKLALDDDFLPSDCTFVLYNFSRLSMLLDSHSRKVQEGLYPPLPPMEEVDFCCLVEDAEWELFVDHIWTFKDVIEAPMVVDDGYNLKVNYHQVVDYLQQLCRCVSAFYSRHHILGENLPHLLSTMNARIYLMKAAMRAMSECFNLLGIKPLTKM